MKVEQIHSPLLKLIKKRSGNVSEVIVRVRELSIVSKSSERVIELNGDEIARNCQQGLTLNIFCYDWQVVYVPQLKLFIAGTPNCYLPANAVL